MSNVSDLLVISNDLINTHRMILLQVMCLTNCQNIKHKKPLTV